MLGWTFACVSGNDIAEILTTEGAPKKSMAAGNHDLEYY